MVLGQKLLLFIATSLVEAHKLILCIICLCTTSTIICKPCVHCKNNVNYIIIIKNYENDNIIY